MLAMTSFKMTLRNLAVVALSGIALTASGVTLAETAPRTIKIATSAESKPLSWGALGVEPEGYEPDVLKAINAKLPQYKFAMEGAADIAQETGLVTGKYDMLTGGFFTSEARAKQFLIPESPLGASLMKIYALKGSNLNTLNDLVGKRIVPVTAGGGVYKFVTEWKKQNPDYDIKIPTSSAGIPYPNRLTEVQQGKYDALVLPSNLGEQTVIENQKLDIVASEPVSISNTYILIHKSDENKVLQSDISKVLKELKDNGTLDELSQKWFGEPIAKYMK
jgi:L-cystine transport system substrate-binding protein